MKCVYVYSLNYMRKLKKMDFIVFFYVLSKLSIATRPIYCPRHKKGNLIFHFYHHKSHDN